MFGRSWVMPHPPNQDETCRVGVFRDLSDHVVHRLVRKRPLPVLGFWARIGSYRVSIDRILHAGQESGTAVSLSLPVRAIIPKKGPIQRHVEPGTTIHTDEWRGYSGLEELKYGHSTV